MNSQVRDILWALLLLLVSPAWSAAVLHGIVSDRRERGAPMAGVEVSVQGSNAVTTGNDGRFVLSFPSKSPGQDVRVGVRRAGWDVVNDVQLDYRLAADSANSRPLEIIICPVAERELRVAELYRVKGNQSVQQNYKAKLAELEGRQTATAQERDRLLRERDDALKLVEDAAQHAAALKPLEVDGVYREALRLFLNGKADGALQMLSDERLQLEAAQANDRLKQAVQGWLLKGQLLSSRFEFEAAGRTYDHAVRSAPGVFDAWFGYAAFHQNQNGFQKARRGYEQALVLARQSSDEAGVALTLINLGGLGRTEGRHGEAREQLQEALVISRSLAQRYPDRKQNGVALALTNLAVVSTDENRIDEARQQFHEALDIRRSDASNNPEVYLPFVQKILHNLGMLNSKARLNDEARKNYQEALDISRSLALKNPEVFNPYSALTLNNLCALNFSERRHEESREQCQEALTFFRSAAQNNPDVYLPLAAKQLTNLGLISEFEKRYAESRKHFQEALDIYRSLAQNNPDVYLPDIALVLSNMGALSSSENLNVDAVRQHQEALTIRRKLAQRNPEIYLPHVAASLNYLGLLSFKLKLYIEARTQYKEALDIIRQQAEINPDAHRAFVAMTLMNLALLSSTEERYNEAREQYNEALDIFRLSEASAPAVFSPLVKRIEATIPTLHK